MASRRAMRALRRRVGHRGATLLFFALVDYAYGKTLIWPSAERRSSSLFTYLADLAPLWAWGAGWLAVAVVATVHAFRRRDEAGFGACILLKVFWILTLIFGAFRGVDSAWLSATIWLGTALYLLNAASWPEPSAGLPSVAT